MMTRKEQLEDAFKAYNSGVMSDEQLSIAHTATKELVETMDAMGIKGAPLIGFIMQEQALDRIIHARRAR